VLAAIQQVQRESSGQNSKTKLRPANDPGRPSFAAKKADDYDGSHPVGMKTYDDWEKQVKQELDQEEREKEKEKREKAPNPAPKPEPKKM
jgi:hypothetical protein